VCVFGAWFRMAWTIKIRFLKGNFGDGVVVWFGLEALTLWCLVGSRRSFVAFGEHSGKIRDFY
jgi:hypothetical protein